MAINIQLICFLNGRKGGSTLRKINRKRITIEPARSTPKLPYVNHQIVSDDVFGPDMDRRQKQQSDAGKVVLEIPVGRTGFEPIPPCSRSSRCASFRYAPQCVYLPAWPLSLGVSEWTPGSKICAQIRQFFGLRLEDLCLMALWFLRRKLRSYSGSE